MNIRIKITREGNPDRGKIVTTDIEEYLRGVIPSEMYASDPPEALKAQAVAARTWAARRIKPTQAFDVDDTANCQAYRPHDRIDKRTDAAVAATRGQVLMHAGKLIDAVYTDSNGGRVMSSLRRWGNAIPYLVDKNDPYDPSGKVSGHGVGLSQQGARQAAKQGLSYKEILAFYYPGCAITQLKEELPMAIDYDKKLSPNFAVREFFHPQNYTDKMSYASAEAALEGRVLVDAKLVGLLEGLRAHIRKQYPEAVIQITPHGGYRPTKLNTAVGGANGSQHRYGRAADFRVRIGAGKYMDAPTLAVTAERFMTDNGFRGGVGMYKATDNYIHVDVRGTNVAWYDSYSSAGCPGQGGRPCVYKAGTKGAGVVLIQRFLGIPADGKYGTKTAEAVKQWQAAHGLLADGVFGSKTNVAMGGVLPW